MQSGALKRGQLRQQAIKMVEWERQQERLRLAPRLSPRDIVYSAFIVGLFLLAVIVILVTGDSW